MNENLAAALRGLDYQDPEGVELRRKAMGVELTPDQEEFLRGLDAQLEHEPIVSPFDNTQHGVLRNNT